MHKAHKIEGPFCLMERTFEMCAENTRLRHVVVHSSSINAVNLYDEYPKTISGNELLLPCEIQECPYAEKLIVKNTSVVTQWPGFRSLMLLSFSPKCQLITNEINSEYEGAQFFHLDHKFSEQGRNDTPPTECDSRIESPQLPTATWLCRSTFSVYIDNEDINKINRFRKELNSQLTTLPGSTINSVSTQNCQADTLYDIVRKNRPNRDEQDSKYIAGQEIDFRQQSLQCHEMFSQMKMKTLQAPDPNLLRQTNALRFLDNMAHSKYDKFHVLVYCELSQIYFVFRRELISHMSTQEHKRKKQDIELKITARNRNKEFITE